MNTAMNDNASTDATEAAGAAVATATAAMPDRLAVDPGSPHHIAAVFEHDIGIRLNGQERFDVEEYCISEGWVKVRAGKTKDRKGNLLMMKLKGKVEAFYRTAAPSEGASAAATGS